MVMNGDLNTIFLNFSMELLLHVIFKLINWVEQVIVGVGNVSALWVLFIHVSYKLNL